MVALWVLSVAFAQDDVEEPVGEEADAAGADAEAEAEEPAKDCPVPDVVEVGSYVNNIQVFDLQTHTYELDGYIWFKWCNPDLDPGTSMEFLNASESWGHMLTPNYEEPEELDDGRLYQVVRVQGRFSTKMPLGNYPFDRQNIGWVFEDSLHDTSVMTYAPDPLGPASLNPTLVMPGYLLGLPELRITEAAYPTNFGDPRVPEQPPYARAFASIPLSRPLVSQVTLLMTPVFCNMICAAMMFVLGPKWIDSRVGVGTTAMLTIVALQMTYNQDLPDVGYLMLMDKVYLASYVFVLLGLAVVLWTGRMVDRNEPEKRAWTWQIVGLGASSIWYAATVTILIWLAMAGG